MSRVAIDTTRERCRLAVRLADVLACGDAVKEEPKYLLRFNASLRSRADVLEASRDLSALLDLVLRDA